MTRRCYVIATGEDWGAEVFNRVSAGRPDETWVLRQIDSVEERPGMMSLRDVCEQVDPRCVFLVDWRPDVLREVSERWPLVSVRFPRAVPAYGGRMLIAPTAALIRRVIDIVRVDS